MAGVETEQPDPLQVANGRRYLLVALSFLALTSLAVTATYLVRIGPGQLPQQLTRLALLLALGYFVLRGQPWARWVLLLLLLGGLWVAIPVLTRDGAFARDNLAGTLALLTMYVGYGVVARGLLYSESVRAFFRFHKLDRIARKLGGKSASTPAT